MKKSEIMKKFYGWLDEKYGNAHPHRQHMKMAWMEAFKQGVEFATQPSVEADADVEMIGDDAFFLNDIGNK